MAEFNVTALDHNDIKDSLKEFLRGDATFTDYNYEGSGLSTIVDLLTRNDHYIAFLANMVANESFIDTAQLRSTVVSHAKRLSYTPKSKGAATAVVDLRVIPFDKSALPTNISLEPNRLFVASYDGKAVTFINPDAYTLTKDGNDEFVGSNIVLKHGEYISQNWTFQTGNKPIFELANPNIDTSTLKVKVINSASDQTTTTQTRATDITEITGTSPVYFLYENHDGKYQIEFGDNVLGKSLVDGNIVNVEYLAVPESEANGCSSFHAASSIAGYTNVVVTTVEKAYGGADKESVERIRHLAPKSYTAQNRAVTTSDYEVIVMRDNTNLKSAKSWGGQKNIPVRYGHVFVAVLDESGFDLTQNELTNIQNNLEKYSVAGIQPIVLNAKIIDLNLDVKVRHNPSKTIKSPGTLNSSIVDIIDEYSNTRLEAFEFDFNRAQLEKMILDKEPSVTALEFDLTMGLDTYLVAGSSNVTESFRNQIEPGSLDSDEFTNASNKTGSLSDENGDVFFAGSKIGTVDYTTGTINFTINVSLPITVTVTAKPVRDNIFAVNTNVLKIGYTSVGSM